MNEAQLKLTYRQFQQYSATASSASVPTGDKSEIVARTDALSQDDPQLVRLFMASRSEGSDTFDYRYSDGPP